MRRIARRAVQQAGTIGLDPPFLSRLAEVVVEQMGDAYPELPEHRDEIRGSSPPRRRASRETLARGTRLFEEIAAGGEAISGADAFQLHDTYGFPFELTQELARERGLAVDEDEFEQLMAEQRERSRAGGGGELEVGLRARAASDRVRRLREDRRADGDLRARGARGRALRREAPRVAVLPGGRRPGLRHRLDRERGDGRAGRAGAARRASATIRCSLPRRGLRGRRPRACGRPLVASASRRWRTTQRRTCCTRRSRRCSATTSKQAGSAVRPDKLRFDFTHPAGADVRGARAEVERHRQREGVREPAGAHVRDADRGGAQARRDDALRREVRRRGARDRDPGLLARALRRHARALRLPRSGRS